jgi:uncharacterized protein (DUF362 family)/Pyruvate/2-oxoacid:ferredoxin oxidoreductase delta subunit
MQQTVYTGKCERYETKEIEKILKKAIEELDIQIPRKKYFLIKPNILSAETPDKAITTNPAVVDAICNILEEYGSKIIIAESSGLFSENKRMLALEKSGIKAVADKHKIKILPFEHTKIKNVHAKNAKILKEIPLSSLIDEIDYIINVPKLKTHSLVGYTGAVKNLFGCIPGGFKQNCHSIAKDSLTFSELLLDIYEVLKDKILFNVLDGIVGLEGDGPGTGGSPRQTGLIAVSKDALALDFFASKTICFKENQIKTNVVGKKRGLIDPEDIKAIGYHFPKVCYKKPFTYKIGAVSENLNSIIYSEFFVSKFKAKPHLIKEQCIRCKECTLICPVKAVSFEKYPSFDYKSCIRCYCCHEICPRKAISLKRPWLIDKIIKSVSFAGDILSKRKKD